MIKSDFKKAHLKDYDYVYLYLFPEQLRGMEDRIFSHINDSSIIVSNSFVFAKHMPFDVITDDAGKKVIYLYRK